MVLHRIRAARLRRRHARRGRDAVRSEHGQVPLRVEARGIPGMGEDGQETEVPRWGPGKRAGRPPSRHHSTYGAEGKRADRRADLSACYVELSPDAKLGRQSLSPVTPDPFVPLKYHNVR